MVLIDTSVWIRFLMGREPFVREVKRLLDVGEAAAHDLVHGELLIDDPGGRKKLLDDYDELFHAAVVPHNDVVAFVEMRNLHRARDWLDRCPSFGFCAGEPFEVVDRRFSFVSGC
jgi:hypothetical protein